MLDGCYIVIEEWRAITDKAIKTETGVIIPISQCGIFEGGLYVKLWILRKNNLPIIGEAIEFYKLQDFDYFYAEASREIIHKPKNIEPVFNQEAINGLRYY